MMKRWVCQLWYWSRIPTYPIDFWGIRDDGYTVGWASPSLICDVHSPYHVSCLWALIYVGLVRLRF